MESGALNEDHPQSSDWDRIIGELRAYKEVTRKMWGDLDDTVLAVYISGRASEEESQAVEAAMDSCPAVKELVTVVREVLDAVAVPAEVPVVNAIWTAKGRVADLIERLVSWVDEGGKASSLRTVGPSGGYSTGTCADHEILRRSGSGLPRGNLADSDTGLRL